MNGGEKVSENWTAEVVGRMHVARITGQALARECGYSAAYVSTVLNGKRGTEETKKTILAALARLEAKCSASESAAAQV